MNYDKAREYINEMSRYGSVPGLDSIRELCRRLGDPQEAVRIVHVAGTNGKGSTVAYLSSILLKAGYRTGTYTSPAVTEYRERFCACGKMIAKAVFARLLESVAKEADAMEAEGLAHPTAFEIETALAFCFFAEKKCDIAVVEVGMGGLLDATNLIRKPLVSVIASVSMDHTQYLGKTLAEIAAHKAGIIKEGCPVVSMAQAPEAMRVIRDTAERLHAPLAVADVKDAAQVKPGLTVQTFSYGGYRNLKIALAGLWQIENAVLAVETVRVLNAQGSPAGEGEARAPAARDASVGEGEARMLAARDASVGKEEACVPAAQRIAVSEKALREGLMAASWPGRMTVIAQKPLFLIDGAHNEDAAAKLEKSFSFYFTNVPKVFIIGVLRDKDYEKIIARTAHLADQIITVTPPENARALAAYELAGEVSKVNVHVTAADSLEEAVEMAYLLAPPDGMIAAFGSLSYLGRLSKIVKNRKPRR